VGWQITVVTEFTFPCIFARASNEELICKALQRNGAAVEPGEIQVRRDRIHEVRVERRDGANMLAGAAGAGGAGAILGTIITTASRGPAAYILGIAGASTGARTGRDLHISFMHISFMAR